MPEESVNWIVIPSVYATGTPDVSMTDIAHTSKCLQVRHPPHKQVPPGNTSLTPAHTCTGLPVGNFVYMYLTLSGDVDWNVLMSSSPA